jgi:hypothetical protein
MANTQREPTGFSDSIDLVLSEWKIPNEEDDMHLTNEFEDPNTLLDSKANMKRKRAFSNTPPPSNSNSASKSRRTSVYQSAADTAKEGMKDLGKSMAAAM